jgi:hypothetical protein
MHVPFKLEFDSLQRPQKWAETERTNMRRPGAFLSNRILGVFPHLLRSFSQR